MKKTPNPFTDEQVFPPKKPRDPDKKKRRVFLWFYLAMQAVFLIWIIAGAQGNHCSAQGSVTANNACTAGTGIGIALVIALWVAADIIVGGAYAIYRLSTRNR